MVRSSTESGELPIENKENQDRPLKKEEILEALNSIEDQFGADKKEYGLEFVFPPDIVIAGENFGGRPVTEALNYLKAQLETYEGGITGAGIQTEENESAPDEIPVWLKEHPELMWQGPVENPIWRAAGKQYEDKVVLSYERRNVSLKPGRDEKEQLIKIETAKNVFTLDEWKIAEEIFREYETLQLAAESNDVEERLAALIKILGIGTEENKRRRGGSDPGNSLGKKINAVVDRVAKARRGFKKETIDIEDLTQRIADILSQMMVLNSKRERTKQPKLKADIVEYPTFQAGLERLSEHAEEQVKSNKGLTLLMGEAGTGKNELVEYFAARTKRPFYSFACGRGMESVDLVNHYEFDTQEGTKRFLTALAEGLQTPGAVVLIDEINALKPEVQAILHGLGDARRSLDYDGISIPVAEDVIIIIAGNPATYGSAGNIGEALISRTMGQALTMEYPAFTKGQFKQAQERWSDAKLEEEAQKDNGLKEVMCDEALVLYRNLPEFSELSTEAFSMLWENVVNDRKGEINGHNVSEYPELQKFITGPESELADKSLKDMVKILKMADRWRRNYIQRTGDYSVGLSLRDTIALVKAYNKTRDVEKAYLNNYEIFRMQPKKGLDALYLKLQEDLLNI